MLGALALGAYMWALEGLWTRRSFAHRGAVCSGLGPTWPHVQLSLSQPLGLNGLFRNPFIWIAVLVVVLLQLSAVYLSPLAAALGTVKPSLTDWI